MTESVLNTQYGGEHYKGKAIQPVEYAHANNLSFFQGNVVKYVTRYKDKKGAEDIEKAVHYLQMILEFEYGVKTSFKKEEDISEQECVDYHQKLWKEGTTQPQSQAGQEKPWYPPVEDGGNPWIEWNKGYCPEMLDDLTIVQWLSENERLNKEFDCTEVIAKATDWTNFGYGHDIVAYRVVKW